MSWPFTTAELTAGLRRYFDNPALQVIGVQPDTQNHLRADWRGLVVEYDLQDGEINTVRCALKEPRLAPRAGLAGPGAREIGIYRSLASQLPLRPPPLIAADPAGQWLVLEAIDAEEVLAPAHWQAEDYRRAVRALVDLHERFWGLADDLAVYQWLDRPLTTDFDLYVYAAARSVEKIMTQGAPRRIAASYDVLMVLGQVVAEAEKIAHALSAEPPTLLHGNYRPSSILLPLADDDDEGDILVSDWQQVGVGTGVLDLVEFVAACQWERPDLPIAPSELIALYRAEVQRRGLAEWSDEAWEAMWDYALIWRFLQEAVSWVAEAPRAEFATSADWFERVWLQPVLSAARQRLSPVLYL